MLFRSEEVSKHQFFTPTNTGKQPKLVEAYEQDGVYRLLEEDKDASSTIIWQLAKSIQEIYYNQHLLPKAFNQDDLTNAFEGGVP